jgi:hypothetical protein
VALRDGLKKISAEELDPIENTQHLCVLSRNHECGIANVRCDDAERGELTGQRHRNAPTAGPDVDDRLNV